MPTLTNTTDTLRCLPATASASTGRPVLLPLGAMLLASSLGAMAQTAPAATATLPTVTIKEPAEPEELRAKNTLRVTDTRLGKGQQELRDIPQNITVMTERLIDDRQLDDFRDILKTTAGVTFLAGETGEEDVRMRGFSLGQAGDIFRDGLREGQLLSRDTFASDRVEIIKGSASALFGKGSTGGVINQVTKQPFLFDRYELDASIGSGNHQRVQLDLNKQLSPSSAIRVNAMVQEADNWGASNDRQGLAVSWRTGISERNEFQLDLYHLQTRERPNYNHPWLLSGVAGDTVRHIIPVLPAKNYYGLASDYQHTDQTTISLTHTHRFSAREELRTTLRHGTYERDLWVSAMVWTPAAQQPGGNAISISNPPTAASRLNRNPKGRYGQSDITQIQSDYSHRIQAGGIEHHLTAGVDLTIEDARRNNSFAGAASGLSTTVGTPNDGAWRADTRGAPPLNTFKADSLGLYVQNVATITPELKLVGGLRFDRFQAAYQSFSGAGNEMRENLWSPRVGANFQPTPTSAYYVSWGESYNTSGDTYQFSNADQTFTGNNARMANTPPEKSRNFEIGAKWDLFEQRASLNVALFHSEKFNERNTDPDSASTLMLLSGKRHATGLEISAAGRITPQWEVFYNHTWIPQARIDQCNATTCTGNMPRQGDRPGLTPEHSLSLWSTYRIAHQWRVGLGATYRSDQSTLMNRINTARAFTVWDGMVEYTVDEKTSIKLNVSNLTDKLYADGLYHGFFTPGAPRKVMLSVKSVF